MGKIYGGNSNVGHKIQKIYTGVNNTAKSIEKVYVGVNGVARQVYPTRVYLFSSITGDNTALTGGWNSGSFYHQTNSGTNYSMTRMNITTWQNLYLISGTYSSTNGTSEKAMFAKTNNAINFTPYRKLHINLDRRTNRDTSPVSSYFGVFNSQGSNLTCKTNELETKFLAYATHPNNVTSGYVGLSYDIDISNINGSYVFVYDNYHSNMNAEISINIVDIWME